VTLTFDLLASKAYSRCVRLTYSPNLLFMQLTVSNFAEYVMVTQSHTATVAVLLSKE